MVKNVLSLSRSGLSDFVIQRVTAMILTLFVLCVVGFFIANPGMDYVTLRAYFASTPMKIFSILAVLATVAHAWIGMWTVGTDYIREHYFGAHATSFRVVYQLGCLLILFVYALWGINIFWSL
jgi:succinate dehydrogenase / fumarate reductase membrane anchor subunit